MRRALVSFAGLVLVTGMPQYVAAASPVTGTVSCTAEATMPFGRPYLPEELAEPLVRPLQVKVLTENSTCDGSGVVGARSPITSVDVRLGGKLGSETSCIDFLGTLSLTAKVKLRWRALLPNFSTGTVGSSKATVASAAYDSGTDSLVIVTNPLSGAFAGQTVTMRFPFYDGAAYGDDCANRDFRYTSLNWRADNRMTIDVP